jgi:hypothetical protein
MYILYKGLNLLATLFIVAGIILLIVYNANGDTTIYYVGLGLALGGVLLLIGVYSYTRWRYGYKKNKECKKLYKTRIPYENQYSRY